MPEEEEVDEALDAYRGKHDEIYQAVLAMLGQRHITGSIAGIISNRVEDAEADNAEKENHFAQPSHGGTSKSAAAATSSATSRGKGRPPKTTAATKVAAAPKAAKATKKELNISVRFASCVKITIHSSICQICRCREKHSQPFNKPCHQRKTPDKLEANQSSIQ